MQSPGPSIDRENAGSTVECIHNVSVTGKLYLS